MGKQLCKAALLLNLPAFYHDDMIRTADGADPMGNQQHGNMLVQIPQHLPDETFVFIIQGCGGFIQHQQCRI